MFGLQKKTEDKAQVAQDVTYRPAVDIAETETGYAIYADVPGANRDSVDVTYEDGVVIIKATAQAAPEQKPAQAIHREFRRASYQRSFRVGEDVDTDGIGAEIANGVLKVTLPRKASAKKTIAVAAQ